MIEKKEKKEKAAERINQFIIECLFNKYFEEKEEIASVAPSGLPRNDRGAVLQDSSK